MKREKQAWTCTVVHKGLSSIAGLCYYEIFCQHKSDLNNGVLAYICLLFYLKKYISIFFFRCYFEPSFLMSFDCRMRD